MYDKFKEILRECYNLFALYLLKVRGIRFFYFLEVKLNELDNLDDFEKRIVELNSEKKLGNITLDFDDRYNEEKFPDWILLLEKMYGERWNEEYVQSITKASNVKTFMKNGFPYRVHHSQYVNYVDGHRMVCKQPVYFATKVLVLGVSTITGARMEDADTVPSQMQAYFIKGGYKDVLVDEYDFPGVEPRPLLKYALKSCLRRGDVVALYHIKNDNLIRWYAKRHGCMYELKKLVFDDRHKWRGNEECFYDMRHYNHVSSARIANISGEIISLSVNKKQEECTRRLVDEIPIDKKLKKTLKVYRELAVRHTNKNVGAIVMNCNPFTKGHQYLIDTALKQTDFLYIFIVEENRSEFPFEERMDLVKKHYQGIEDKVCVLGSGNYIISSETFPEYFDKTKLQKADIDPSVDLDYFGRFIAPSLNISIRFVGSEPKDNVTRQYNEAMHRILNEYGIEVREFERIGVDGTVVSASTVRSLLEEGNWVQLKKLLPDETYYYLKNR